MIKNITINNSTKKVVMKKEDRTLGVQGENKYETLKFIFEDDFLDGEGILEIQKPNSQKEYIILEKEEDCYLLEVKNSLLSLEGEIIMQLVVRMTDNRVFKSVEFSMQVLKAIEATTEIPDEYETWDSTLAAKILEIDSKLEDMTELEQDLEDKLENGYFKGEKGDTGEPGQNGTNGIDGQDGQDGQDGADGKSAYQIWLEEGNVGTEQDFLDSLKGADGRNGIDGKDGVDGTNGQDGYTPIKGVDYWTNQDKAEIVQSSVTQVEADLQPTITSIENTADTANSTANTAKRIAEGANQALSYGNYQTMITAFNALANNIYNVGQNVMIITLEVPDLWISSIESTSQAYTYTTDEAFTTALAINGYVQVGHYKLSALETQKVDLTNYVTNTDYATSNKGGVVKTANGLAISNGTPYASSRTYNQYLNDTAGYFISKSTLENVITGKNLETGNNKVTTISSSSTNTEYPSAKAVYDYIQSLDGDEVSY